MQEPRQLAGSKPLFDLLLETPDQKHLAQEVAQALLGYCPPFFDLGHAP
jgi:hypothetical protein